MENFRSASRTINNKFSGDCDDFAILLAALVESIGGSTRISFAYNEEGGHAFTEVFVTDNKESMPVLVQEINKLYGTNKFRINYYEDADGKCWLNLDWFGQPQHPGGQYFDFTKRTIYYPTAQKPFYTQEIK
jgi:transglutaminase-like putative cysteine protease